MSKVKETQFILFGTMATITLILFANTDEGGGDFDPFLQYLAASYLVTILSLLILVVYEYIFKPLLSPSNKTSNSEDDDQELTTIADSFNVRDSGALNIGSVLN